jgi:glycosyltransferase involved in cell wall biosynthesis
MNILCLTDAAWPDRAGGISRTVALEVEGLSKRGHSVVVVSRRLNLGALDFEDRGSHLLYRFAGPAPGPLAPFTYPVFTATTLPPLLRKLHARFRFDVAYTNNLFQALALQMSAISLPSLYVFHASAHREIEIDSSQGKYGKLTSIARLATRLVRPVEQGVLRRSSKLLARSAFMKGEVDSLYGAAASKQVSIVPLGVDTAIFKFAESPNCARDSLGLPAGIGPVIFTARRLVARTGVQNAVLAMREVVRVLPNAVLLIAGVGYLGEQLRRLIAESGLSENVTLLGFIPDEQLVLYCQAADLYLMPTQAYEGFGLATLEALSCGTPVVCTPVGANPEVLAPLDPDLVASGSDPSAIAIAMIRWLKLLPDSSMRQRCGSYCREKFSCETVCEQLDSLLHEVVRLEGKS